MAASLIKNKVAFGHYLANLLKERQVERKELARQLKISETFLSYVIQGKKGMSIETMEVFGETDGQTLFPVVLGDTCPPVGLR